MKIVVLGGGASGTVFVTARMRHASPSDELCWIEQTGVYGPGLAYSEQQQDYHLLNVRAGNMSAVADDPNHFLRWLSGNNIPCNPEDFVSRKTYGKYLLSVAEQTKSDQRILHLVATVQRVEKTNSGWRITLSNKQEVDADTLILATGNLLPARPAVVNDDLAANAKYVGNPWMYNVPATPSNHPVLLLGAGLTMVDQVLYHEASGYSGQLISLSPHGFLPLAHPLRPQKVILQEADVMLHNDPIRLVAFLREQYVLAQQNKQDVFALADGLRPYVQKIWLSWNAKQRTAFREHLRHRWGQWRHRLPLRIAKQLDTLRSTEKLIVYAGRLLAVEETADGLLISWRKRGETEIRKLQVARLINCTGPSSRYVQDGPSFLRELLREGILAMDEQQLGLNALPNGQLKAADETVHANAYALGSLIRGIVWEITAIPDIRTQVATLVAELTAN